MIKNGLFRAKIALYCHTLVLLTFILTTACTPPGRNGSDGTDPGQVGTRKFTVSQLQNDFSSLRAAVENNHPMLYFYYSKSNFDNFFNNAFASIQQEMTELEFFRLLAPVMARVNCGHTNIRPSTDFEYYLNNSLNVIPLGVVFIGDKAYIYQDYSQNDEIEPGTEILSINNMAVSNIKEKLLGGLFSDGLNVTKKIHTINKYFFRYYSLLIDNPGSFELECMLPGSDKKSNINLNGRLYRDVLSSFRNQNPGEDVYALRYDIQGDISTAIITVKSFLMTRNSHFQSFFNDFFQKIADKNINNLIIDVRGNGGGDPQMSMDLIKYLVDSDFVYFAEGLGYNQLKKPIAPYNLNFKGNLFILINGGCFSSTGHFCSLVQYLTNAVFIGEETGGSFSCNDNHMERTLSNTKIRAVIARTTYSTAVTGYKKGRGIMPDHEVIPTIEDRINAFDREMDYVLDLIRQLKAGSRSKSGNCDH